VGRVENGEWADAPTVWVQSEGELLVYTAHAAFDGVLSLAPVSERHDLIHVGESWTRWFNERKVFLSWSEAGCLWKMDWRACVRKKLDAMAGPSAGGVGSATVAYVKQTKLQFPEETVDLLRRAVLPVMESRSLHDAREVIEESDWSWIDPEPEMAGIVVDLLPSELWFILVREIVRAAPRSAVCLLNRIQVNEIYWGLVAGLSGRGFVPKEMLDALMRWITQPERTVLELERGIQVATSVVKLEPEELSLRLTRVDCSTSTHHEIRSITLELTGELSKGSWVWEPQRRRFERK
jgi:hypothetical protein